MFSSISEFGVGRWAGGDVVLRVAIAVAAIALVVTVGLVLQVLFLRWREGRRRRRWDAVVARWRPLLLATAGGTPVELPPLARAEREELLLLWNQLQESLRGSAHQALNDLALRLGLGRLARHEATAGRGWQRLLGLSTLAHLGQAEDWSLLDELLDDPRWFVGMAAARALLRIDPARGSARVIERFLARHDWPLARLGTLLREGGAQAAAPALAERLRHGTPEEQVRLLPVAPLVFSRADGGVIAELLAGSRDAAVLEAALAQVFGPAALPRVRELTAHADWQVRAQAAVALGRLGQAEDRERLLQMLRDPQWWVRYRAAHALLALPGMSAPQVVALCASLGDRFARDIVAQAAAERLLQVRST